MMTRVLQNAIKLVSTGQVLLSFHVHDFIPFKTNDGVEGFIDGGCEYIRVGGAAFGYHPDVEHLSICENESLENKVNKALWGTYGKDGKQPRQWVFLKDCTTEHLEAILDNCPHIKGKWIEEVIVEILSKRDVNKTTESSV